MRRTAVAALAVACLAGAVAFGQSRFDGYWGFRRTPPKFPDPDRPNRNFSFCRVLYESVRREYLGHGWDTDYPFSDTNLMIRLSELTKAAINRDPRGDPDHVVVRLTDDSLFEYPFIFMSDVGTLGLGDEEVERLREYLLKGGLLWVDDFWGPRAWDHFTREMSRVLPGSDYPVVDLPLDHPVFHGLYQVERVPQIPSIQFWRRSGGHYTSEQGADSAEPHFRGIQDRNGRLLVFISHNTDIADGWEREGEDNEFFHRFSIDAYAVGINVVLYAMTH